jgi:flagellar biosynthesis protein FliR
MKLEEEKMPRTTFHTVLWLILRLVILNASILALSVLLALIRNLIEQTDVFVVRFPFELFVTAFLLTNLVYVIGNFFEIVYLKLWDKKLNIYEFERKFFKSSVVMMLFVNTIGVVRYFIYYFG